MKKFLKNKCKFSGPDVVSTAFFDSTSPGPAASPIGWSGPHTANQNEGDLYPFDDETSQEGYM
jgi:hypothetical protein